MYSIKQPIALLLITALFVFAPDLTAQSPAGPQAVFDEANEALENNNYAEALALYRELEQSNTISGPLFLNMGLTYIHLDSLGYAKYYFLKAREFNETEERADEALAFVESQFSRQSAMLPKLPWDMAVEWLRDNPGPLSLLAIAIIMLNAGIILFIAKWFFAGFERLFHFSGLIMAGLAVLLILTSFYTKYVGERYSTAVQITQKTPVLEHPRQDASLISQAYEGYTFTVDQSRSSEHPEWQYIRMSNGLYGWISESDIRVL